MGPPLQDFLCAFEPSNWVFPAAHSANCCVQVEPTSEAAHPLNSSIACGTHRSHSRPKTIGKVWSPSLPQDSEEFKFPIPALRTSVNSRLGLSRFQSTPGPLRAIKQIPVISVSYQAHR